MTQNIDGSTILTLWTSFFQARFLGLNLLPTFLRLFTLLGISMFLLGGLLVPFGSLLVPFRILLRTLGLDFRAFLISFLIFQVSSHFSRRFLQELRKIDWKRNGFSI